MFGLWGKVIDGVKDVALEMWETDKESAEAKALMVKVLDPNGKMRKQISEDVTQMYKVYIYSIVALIGAQAFGVADLDKPVESLTGLFIPITAMFSAIVGASFGVNSINSFKGK